MPGHAGAQLRRAAVQPVTAEDEQIAHGAPIHAVGRRGWLAHVGGKLASSVGGVVRHRPQVGAHLLARAVYQRLCLALGVIIIGHGKPPECGRRAAQHAPLEAVNH